MPATLTAAVWDEPPRFETDMRSYALPHLDDLRAPHACGGCQQCEPVGDDSLSGTRAVGLTCSRTFFASICSRADSRISGTLPDSR